MPCIRRLLCTFPAHPLSSLNPQKQPRQQLCQPCFRALNTQKLRDETCPTAPGARPPACAAHPLPAFSALSSGSPAHRQWFRIQQALNKSQLLSAGWLPPCSLGINHLSPRMGRGPSNLGWKSSPQSTPPTLQGPEPPAQGRRHVCATSPGHGPCGGGGLGCPLCSKAGERHGGSRPPVLSTLEPPRLAPYSSRVAPKLQHPHPQESVRPSGPPPPASRPTGQHLLLSTPQGPPSPPPAPALGGGGPQAGSQHPPATPGHQK